MTARLPDFVVAGVRKAGTTWLDTCLRSHPQIHLAPATKELFFFDRYYSRGLTWYGSHFAKAPAGTMVCDISPSYFAHEAAPARLARDLPRAHVIILLRDPVKRAWSDFVHHWSKGDLPKHTSFTAACSTLPSILDESMYGRHLARWLEHVPAERLRVFVLEDAAADPASFVSGIYDFLGVDATRVPPQVLDRVNEARRPRSHRIVKVAVGATRSLHGHGLHRVVAVANRIGLTGIVMASADRGLLPGGGLTSRERKELAQLFAPEVEHLSNLVGRDLALTWTLDADHRPN